MFRCGAIAGRWAARHGGSKLKIRRVVLKCVQVGRRTWLHSEHWKNGAGCLVKKCLIRFVNQGPINSADAFGLGGTLNVGSIQSLTKAKACGLIAMSRKYLGLTWALVVYQGPWLFPVSHWSVFSESTLFFFMSVGWHVQTHLKPRTQCHQGPRCMYTQWATYLR